jgi:DNA polymerase III gamma/tau subunit
MLYQKYRPKTLDEFIGNKVTVDGLRAMLSAPNKPHAILFKGLFGLGKTTLARIWAKEVGAKEAGIIELNAANTNGIDTVRGISERIHLSVIGGGVKVVIWDESAQLTTAAMEALIKDAEDTPEDSYFIFCTSAPEKMIPGLRAKFTEYQVNRITNDEIMGLLLSVCSKEGFSVSNDVLSAIVYTSNGCPREALIRLEQVAPISDLNTAIELLVKGSEHDVNVISLGKLLMMNPDLRKMKWRSVLDTFFEITDEPEKVRKSLLTFFMNKLRKCNEEKDAKDIEFLIKNFSVSVFYTGQAMLAAQVVSACIGDK